MVNQKRYEEEVSRVCNKWIPSNASLSMHPVLHNVDLEKRNVDRMSKLWEKRL